jgi:hypothetical protein
MGYCCKRWIGFFVFLIFGIICSIVSLGISVDNNNNKPSEYTLTFYGILLITSIRYKQFLTPFIRCCSAFLIIAGYLTYWGVSILLFVALNDVKIFLMIACSIVTAIFDVLVFTSWAYSDETGTLEIISIDG